MQQRGKLIELSNVNEQISTYIFLWNMYLKNLSVARDEGFGFLSQVTETDELDA